MVVRAIIFDLFGTLVARTHPERSIMKRFKLKKDAFPKINKAVCGQKSRDWETYIDGVVKAVGIKNTDANRHDLIEIFFTAFKRGIKSEFAQTKKVLAKLHEKGFKLGLVSEATPYGRRILEETGLIHFFDKVVISSEVGLLKSDPRIYNLCLRGLGVTAENALMVGDSLEFDIKAASRATNGKIRGILISENPSHEAKAAAGCAIASSLGKVPIVVSKLKGQNVGRRRKAVRRAEGKQVRKPTARKRVRRGV